MQVNWKSTENQDKFFIDALNTLKERCGEGPFKIDPVPNQASQTLFPPGKIVSIQTEFGIIGVAARFLEKD